MSKQSWIDSPVTNLLAGRDSLVEGLVSFLFLFGLLLFVELILGIKVTPDLDGY